MARAIEALIQITRIFGIKGTQELVAKLGPAGKKGVKNSKVAVTHKLAEMPLMSATPAAPADNSGQITAANARPVVPPSTLPTPKAAPAQRTGMITACRA
jgi:hypothetical protein